MKKLFVLGITACLLFSFTGSAFAASQTTTHAKNKVVHTAHSTKKILTHAKTKQHTVSSKNKKAKTVHKKAAKTA